jgi:hypothetical protein
MDDSMERMLKQLIAHDAGFMAMAFGAYRRGDRSVATAYMRATVQVAGQPVQRTVRIEVVDVPEAA